MIVLQIRIAATCRVILAYCEILIMTTNILTNKSDYTTVIEMEVVWLPVSTLLPKLLNDYADW